MAKRRRLDISGGPASSKPGPALETKSITRLSGAPPIADIAGQAAAISAAEGAVAEIEEARTDGRLVIQVGLEAIDLDHLVRDRVIRDDDEMAALKASIERHGQRTPVELIDKGNGRFGLISGWRRLSALSALHRETGAERFSRVLAILRKPRDAGDAYVAMVEENEIRVGLSYYERARIAALATERGAFADTNAALDALYAAGSKAKRSKIRAFLLIHEVLGEALSFPAYLSERLGLKLVQAIKVGRTLDLLAALEADFPGPEEEAEALMAVLNGAKTGRRATKKAAGTTGELAPGITLKRTGERLILSGPGVTKELETRLAAFLRGG